MSRWKNVLISMTWLNECQQNTFLNAFEITELLLQIEAAQFPLKLKAKGVERKTSLWRPCRLHTGTTKNEWGTVGKHGEWYRVVTSLVRFWGRILSVMLSYVDKGFSMHLYIECTGERIQCYMDYSLGWFGAILNHEFWLEHNKEVSLRINLTMVVRELD